MIALHVLVFFTRPDTLALKYVDYLWLGFASISLISATSEQRRVLAEQRVEYAAERRREIGLMRAVGMTRRQVRSTVRLESIVIALLGTSLGLAVGTFFGWAIVRAMSDQGIDTLTVPASNLGVIAAVAAVAGAVAAAVPARRASRLEILGAITAD